jgi:hypothetical protein
MVSPAGDDKRNNNRKKDSNKQEPTSENPLETGSMPDLGDVVGLGTYLVSKVNQDGETVKVVSAGEAKLHEHGLALGTEQLGEVMLAALGVKTVDDAHRALHGDGADSGSSSTRVGYNRKYADGWNKLWGSSN